MITNNISLQSKHEQFHLFASGYKTLTFNIKKIEEKVVYHVVCTYIFTLNGKINFPRNYVPTCYNLDLITFYKR